MNNKEIIAHQHVADTMGTYELIDVIRNLSEEQKELKPFLTLQEIKKYDTAIQIYCQKLEYIYASSVPEIFKNSH